MIELVRAKFSLIERTQRAGGNNGVDLTFAAVTSGSEENKSFWKYTPSGRLTMQVLNPEAAAQFELGAEYYLDFTKVPPAVAAPPVADLPTASDHA